MATCTLVYSSGITTNAATYASIILPTQGELIVGLFCAGATVSAGTLADDKGGTYTLVSTANYNTSADGIWAFIGNQLVTTSSMTITFDVTGDNADGCCKGIYSVSGMTRLGSNAFKQAAKLQNQASTTMALVFSANVSSSNPVLGALANASNPAGVTQPSGWTEGSDTGYATPTHGFETVFTNSTFNGTTVTWGSSSATAGGALVIELDTSLITAGGGHLRMLTGVGL